MSSHSDTEARARLRAIAGGLATKQGIRREDARALLAALAALEQRDEEATAALVRERIRAHEGEARAVAAERARDALVVGNDELLGRVQAAERVAATLVDALDTYGVHKILCAKVAWLGRATDLGGPDVGPEPDCTCRFDAVLAAYRARTKDTA